MSKKSHKTETTVAIIGCVGILGGALIANWDKIFSRRSAPTAVQQIGGRQTTAPDSPASAPSQSPAEIGCFERYLSGTPKDRIAVLETGANDVQLVGPQQPNDQIVAIRLLENRRPIGAVKFQFYEVNAIFNIESVVDSRCQSVGEYVNETRGGDKNILQNWDGLRMRLGSATYTLSFGYGSGIIDADFVRTSP